MGRVLVVDDSQAMRHFVAAGLATDFEVEIAGDGAQALGILGAKDIDLVVSDIEMPRMGGFALARAMADAYPRIPLLLLTDSDIEAQLSTAHAHGIFHIFPKQMLNLHFGALVRLLGDLEGRRRAGIASFLSPGGEVRTFVLGGERGEMESVGGKIYPILDHFPRGEIYRAVFGLLMQRAIAQVETLPRQGLGTVLQVAVGGDHGRVGISVRSTWESLTQPRVLSWFAEVQTAGSDGWAFQMVRHFMDQCHLYIGDGELEVVCVDLLEGYEGPRPVSICHQPQG